MNKCPNCSFENKESAKFCVQCGTKLSNNAESQPQNETKQSDVVEVGQSILSQYWEYFVASVKRPTEKIHNDLKYSGIISIVIFLITQWLSIKLIMDNIARVLYDKIMDFAGDFSDFISDSDLSSGKAQYFNSSSNIVINLTIAIVLFVIVGLLISLFYHKNLMHKKTRMITLIDSFGKLLGLPILLNIVIIALSYIVANGFLLILILFSLLMIFINLNLMTFKAKNESKYDLYHLIFSFNLILLVVFSIAIYICFK